MQHMRKHGLDGVERTVEVHIENVPPIILGHVLKQALLCYACIVDKQRYRTELFLDCGNHLLYGSAVCNIGLIPHGFTAVAAEHIDKLLRFIFPLNAVYADGIAVTGECYCLCPADTTGRARYKCNLFHISSLCLKLAVIQFLVQAVLLQKLLVRAAFDDIALFHDEDEICVTDSREPVGNDE